METGRETDLSAQQARAQAPPWLPQAHADARRPPRGGAAPCEGPQAPVGLRAGAADRTRMAKTPAQGTTGAPPRVVTLKRRVEFQRIRKGARWTTAAFVIEAKARGDGDGGNVPSPVRLHDYPAGRQRRGAQSHQAASQSRSRKTAKGARTARFRLCCDRAAISPRAGLPGAGGGFGNCARSRQQRCGKARSTPRYQPQPARTKDLKKVCNERAHVA